MQTMTPNSVLRAELAAVRERIADEDDDVTASEALDAIEDVIDS